MRHENINLFLGLFFDFGIFGVVTEHCSRGSLEDLLNNENVRLDWMFKSSLLMDLIRVEEAGAPGSLIKSRVCSSTRLRYKMFFLNWFVRGWSTCTTAVSSTEGSNPGTVWSTAALCWRWQIMGSMKFWSLKVWTQMTKNPRVSSSSKLKKKRTKHVVSCVAFLIFCFPIKIFFGRLPSCWETAVWEGGERSPATFTASPSLLRKSSVARPPSACWTCLLRVSATCTLTAKAQNQGARQGTATGADSVCFSLL